MTIAAAAIAGASVASIVRPLHPSSSSSPSSVCCSVSSHASHGVIDQSYTSPRSAHISAAVVVSTTRSLHHRHTQACVRDSTFFGRGVTVSSTSHSPAFASAGPTQQRIQATAGVTMAAAAKPAPALISDTDAWKAVKDHLAEIDQTHLRDLLLDEHRCKSLIKEFNGTVVDLSRQRVTEKTMSLLLDLANEANLKEKIGQMFAGEHINRTENRAVLHVALRAPRDEVIVSDGKNVVPDVHAVLDKINDFSSKVRNGEWRGVTGKPLTDVVCIGIGGSFLGPLFVHTSLKTEPKTAEAAGSRRLRFLSNVDPIDVARALNGLHPETTLVVVVSKTFTTAETMLNARTVRSWIIASLGEAAVAKHMVAVSTNLKLVSAFGINPDNAFAFWDWVGGRYSVCSAVGVLPLALQYGFENVQKFLQGAWDMDAHFRDTPFEENIPVLLGLIGVWNSTFLACSSRAILPYCQALAKLAPHIQQVSMESNGKGVTMEGHPVNYKTGEVDFGEPGTNGQHSFYQLIHQGRVIPCDFIGIIKSQQSVYLKGEIVSNHDELMCNFFAQADALAYGKTREELLAEGVPEDLVPHKTFSGNRPSLSILLPTLTPYTVGQILSMYEQQVAVQGFIWGINSFDQWGVELGKVLALKVRNQVNRARNQGEKVRDFNYSTTYLLNRYLQGKTQLLYPDPQDVFPSYILPGTEPIAKPEATVGREGC